MYLAQAGGKVLPGSGPLLSLGSEYTQTCPFFFTVPTPGSRLRSPRATLVSLWNIALPSTESGVGVHGIEAATPDVL